MKMNKPTLLFLFISLAFGINASFLFNSNVDFFPVDEAYSQVTEHDEHNHEEHADHNEVDGHDHAEDGEHDHSEHAGDIGLDEHANHEEDKSGHDEHADHDEIGHDDDDEEGHEGHGHKEHADNIEVDSHAGHDHSEEESSIEFTAEIMDEFGIKLANVGSGTLFNQIEVQGEITTNPETIYHIVPRVSGVVKEVQKKLGEFVEKDELLAVLESRELALLKSAYLAAKEKFDLSDINFKREEELWKKKISAEQDYLAAKQMRAESLIQLHSAEQQLHAVGFSQEYVDNLPNQPDTLLTHFEFRAPIYGQIIEKHLSLGEFIKEENPVLTIADLSTVWINLTIYQKDLLFIRVGQHVEISLPISSQSIEGKISYISPIVDEHTRTTKALVVVDNSNGLWKPGLFINGSVKLEKTPVPVYVPKTSIQRIENDQVVFVKTTEGFEPQVIQTGRSDSNGVEVIRGLKKGQTYVSEGGFAIKAEMDKEAFAHSGHAH